MGLAALAHPQRPWMTPRIAGPRRSARLSIWCSILDHPAALAGVAWRSATLGRSHELRRTVANCVACSRTCKVLCSNWVSCDCPVTFTCYYVTRVAGNGYPHKDLGAWMVTRGDASGRSCSETEPMRRAHARPRNFPATASSSPSRSSMTTRMSADRLIHIRPIYELLERLGFRTTKSVWPLPYDGHSYYQGSDTLADPEYANYVYHLQERGFEIAFHGARMETSERAEIVAAFEMYKKILGRHPQAYAAHAYNRDNLYWGADRFRFRLWRWLYAALGSAA